MTIFIFFQVTFNTPMVTCQCIWFIVIKNTPMFTSVSMEGYRLISLFVSGWGLEPFLKFSDTYCSVFLSEFAFFFTVYFRF